MENSFKCTSTTYPSELTRLDKKCQKWSQTHLGFLVEKNVIVWKGLELYQNQSNLGRQIVFVSQEKHIGT